MGFPILERLGQMQCLARQLKFLQPVGYGLIGPPQTHQHRGIIGAVPRRQGQVEILLVPALMLQHTEPGLRQPVIIPAIILFPGLSLGRSLKNPLQAGIIPALLRGANGHPEGIIDTKLVELALPVLEGCRPVLPLLRGQAGAQ